MDMQIEKTWVEVSAYAVQKNIATLRSFLRHPTKFFAVVKSNAYGHDLILFSKIANAEHVDGFCVDSIEEGITLRVHGIQKPILVMGATLPELWPRAKQHNLTLTLSDITMFKKFIKRGRGISFHIKIDTGMHRQGFYVAQIPFVLRALLHSPVQRVCHGMYTRFAAESDPSTASYTLQQIQVFESARALFQKNGFSHILFHASGTGGIALYHEAHYDMVRAGIGLYGYWPSQKIGISHESRKGCLVKLRPALSWYTRVS